MLRAYTRLLDRRPIATRALTGGSLGFGGDATAQYVESRGSAATGRAQWYDVRRGAAFTSLGSVWQGPVNHAIVQRLRELRTRDPLTSCRTRSSSSRPHAVGPSSLQFSGLERAFPAALGWRSVLHKTMVTQLIANPLGYLPVFFAWTSLVRGLTVEQALHKANAEYLPSLRTTWMIFTPVGLVNFTLVPVRHQATMAAAAGFVYQLCLSLVAGGRRERERAHTHAHGSEPASGVGGSSGGRSSTLRDASAP